ncbi:unnamed protein product [Rhizophagus irregularis]|nr:unnamed protein product [Rhizophagus irregularis]
MMNEYTEKSNPKNKLEIFYNHYFENESSDDDCGLYVDSESESYTMEAGRDERTGSPFGIIEDDVILARNPCGLPSNIVKVKAARNMDLSIYYNVVIFPIFCCWDPRIVKNYKNSPLLALDPRIKVLLIYGNAAWFIRSLAQTDKRQSSEFGIFDKQSIYLAQMSAQLIDATKRGLTINQMFNNTIMKINEVHFGVKEKNVDPDPHIYSFWNDEFKIITQILGDQGENDKQLLSSSSSSKGNEECKSVDYEFLRNFLNTPPVEKYKKLVILSFSTNKISI